MINTTDSRFKHKKKNMHKKNEKRKAKHNRSRVLREKKKTERGNTKWKTACFYPNDRNL